MKRQRDEGSPVRVALYLRQSRDAEMGTDNEGLAVARQRRACEQWVASRKGYVIVDVFEDNDVSATKRRVRPQFQAMLTAARAGDFDVILGYHLDRLTRTIRDLLPLLELANVTGVSTTTVTGDLDLSTDMGRMVAGILAVVANAEVERKAARQVLAGRQRAESGKPYTAGPRPFGFKDDRVGHDRVEAAALRRAYRALLGGASLTSLTRDLNDRQLLTNQGNQWAHQTLRRTLMAPRNAGLREYQGEVVGPATWKGIVDEQTWRTAVSILTDKSRRTNQRPGGERTRLLTGIARCGVCDDGTTVLGASRTGGVPTYRCRTGKHLDRKADLLDEAVRQAVLQRMSRPDARDLLQDHDAPDFEALQAESLTIAHRVAEVRAEFVADDALPTGWLRDTMTALEARRAQVEARMAHAPRALLYGALVDAGDKVAAWDALPLSRQRAVLADLLEITIRKGKVGGDSRHGTRDLAPDTLTITDRPR